MGVCPSGNPPLCYTVFILTFTACLRRNKYSSLKLSKKDVSFNNNYCNTLTSLCKPIVFAKRLKLFPHCFGVFVHSPLLYHFFRLASNKSFLRWKTSRLFFSASLCNRISNTLTSIFSSDIRIDFPY